MLDVQELVRNNQPIYVLNRTGTYLDKQGPYVLEIKDGNRRAATVIIPATRYPFLLSAHAPAKLLANSTELYAALSKGILQLVDPEEAANIMRDPVAQKVVDNAMRRFQPTKRINRKPPELGDRPDDRVPPDANRGNSRVPSEAVNYPPLKVADTSADGDEISVGVSPTVVQLVMDLKSDPGLKEEKYLELYGMEGLKKEDLGYLVSTCGEFPKIRQWARTELAELIGEDGVEEMEAQQEIDDAAAPKISARRKRRGRGKR